MAYLLYLLLKLSALWNFEIHMHQEAWRLISAAEKEMAQHWVLQDICTVDRGCSSLGFLVRGMYLRLKKGFAVHYTWDQGRIRWLNNHEIITEEKHTQRLTGTSRSATLGIWKQEKDLGFLNHQAWFSLTFAKVSPFYSAPSPFLHEGRRVIVSLDCHNQIL